MERKSLKWKTLSSEYLFNDTWLRARKDRCERPDGKIVDPYYVMEYPEWATGLALTKDDKVVLVRQYRHALGVDCIEIPGGCIDATDQDQEEAIKREFLEETGYSFEKVEFLGTTSANPSTNANLMHMFLLTGGEKVQEQDLDGNEEIEVLLVPLPEFIQMLLNNELVQSMHVTTIFYALLRLGKLSIIL
jgi:ADP-ribose pyrophosphatase